MFILTVAAAEAAIGLAILVVFFRNKGQCLMSIAELKGLGIMELLATFTPLIAFIIAFLFGPQLGHKGVRSL